MSKHKRGTKSLILTLLNIALEENENQELNGWMNCEGDCENCKKLKTEDIDEDYTQEDYCTDCLDCKMGIRNESSIDDDEGCIGCNGYVDPGDDQETHTELGVVCPDCWERFTIIAHWSYANMDKHTRAKYRKPARAYFLGGYYGSGYGASYTYGGHL